MHKKLLLHQSNLNQQTAYPKFLIAKKSNLLMIQEKIIGDLGMEMDSTSNRLNFVQVVSFFFLTRVHV